MSVPDDEPVIPSAPPPAYGDVIAHSGRVPNKVEPVGYCGEASCEVIASITPGGLRLDKAVKKGERLIIDFEKVSCCPFNLIGLDPGCRDYIPEELRLKGISQSTWENWCDELMEIQKKAPSVFGCLCIFCFPGLIPQSILCAMFCPISGNHCLTWLPCFYGDWYVALDKWQRRVNAVLNPLDMHAKLKTYKPCNKAPRSLNYNLRTAGKDENYEMSMLEIALTAQESTRLMTESWDNGVNDGCTSGIGRIL